ncbi:MAG: hypothetical protein ACRDJH_17035 [Thermomicrobiales bacterium]
MLATSDTEGPTVKVHGTSERDERRRATLGTGGAGGAGGAGWRERGVRLSAALAILGALTAGMMGFQPATARQQEVQEAGTPAAEVETEAEAEAVGSCAVASSGESATPAIARPVGTPAASSAPGVPADEETAAEIERQARAIAACLTAGDWETVTQLVTGNYLGETYTGGGRLSRAQFLDLAASLSVIPVQIVAVSEVRALPGGANADVLYIFGNQLIHARWDFSFVSPTAATPVAEGASLYQLDAERALAVAPPADATAINVELREYDVNLDVKEVSGTAVVLQGENGGEEEHELLVVRLGGGTRTDDLLTTPGPGLPEGIDFAGQVTIPAGERAELVLVDLEPGAYGIVCLLPDGEGIPHLALGERERFVVE